MTTLRNLLSLVGLLTLVALVTVVVRYEPLFQQFRALDPAALPLYGEMAGLLLESGNAAEATVWMIPVEEGFSVEEVEETLRFVANELNMRNVGELPLYREVRSLTGEPFPFLTIYMFCDPMTAARMVTYSMAFAAYLPCRIILQEDADGRLWLSTLNLDLMIHGGRPLPAELREEALFIRDGLLEIMQRAASGEF